MPKENKVVNTEADAKASPVKYLAEGMCNPGGHIEAMEAAGTRQLAESSVLPTKGLTEGKHGFHSDHREWANKCGIKILGPVDGDLIFTNVELPEGWRQENGGHAMWNKLLDERGRERASIFYKAAFYDRSAHITPISRFVATYDLPQGYEDRRCWGIVKDCGVEIWKGLVLEPTALSYCPGDQLYAQTEKARDQAVSWLVERYPDYVDLNAYWDEPDEPQAPQG